MGKIHTFVINSSSGTNQLYTDNAGTSTMDLRSNGYFIDWSLLPESKYKMNFTFSSSAHSALLNHCVLLYCDMAQFNTTFAQPINSVLNTRLNYSFIGYAQLSLISAKCFLYADVNTNQPLYLENRPSNNQFIVYILNNDLNRTAYEETTLFVDYNLVLTLEEI